MSITEAVKRVLIVDDSSTMRAMLDGVFYSDPGFLVVGLARNADEAIDLVETARPHILLTDLCMPGRDGFALLGLLTGYPALAKVVISTRVNLPQDTEHMLRALGASAVFDKQEIARDPKTFLTALRQVKMARPAPRPAAKNAETTIGSVARFPIPADEPARAKAVRALDIANPEVDPRLNILARHLARLTDYPIAAVNIVAAEQVWIKAAVGIAPTVLARGDTICAHAICASGVTVVTDLQADPTLSALPIVAGGPRLRSYVGAPIVAGKGARIGMACIADTRPRCPTRDELDIVADVAALVAAAVQTPIDLLRSAA